MGLNTGQGADIIQIEAHGDPLGPPTLFDGPVTISLGAGNDTLQLGVAGQTGNRCVFANKMSFDGGTGHDTLLNFDSNTFTGFSQFGIANFESNTPAPVVSSSSSANAATGVPLNGKLAATFSEAMDPLTITTATFTLKRGTTPIAGTVTYIGTTATFSPTGTLAPNAVFTATLTTGAKNLAGNPLASNFTWKFTTGATPDTTAPTVSSTDPLSGTTGMALNKKIAATFSEAMDPLTITTANVTVTAPGLVPVIGTVAYVGTTMTFTPTSTLAPSTTFTATVTTGAKDLAGNALAGNFTWTFTTGATSDTVAPTVSSTDPLSGATEVARNKKIAVTFSKAMDPLTITTANMTVKGPGFAPVIGTVAYVGTTATFTPTSNLAPNTTFTATVTTGAKDLAGNAMGSNFVWTFTTGDVTDTIAPTVSSIDPANSATGVALNKKIAATFSKAMDPLTITTANVTVTAPGLVPVIGTVAYVGTTMTFTPTSTLAPSTMFTATVTTGAKDLAGNPLASNFTWTFTTGATPDTTAPTVSSIAPPNSATGVALNKKIAATFSKAMDPLTITTANVTVTAPGLVPVIGTVAYVGTTMTFTPTSTLAPNTTFTATVTTGAKDLAGNALASNFTWTFTTGATPDTTAPTVSSINPTNQQNNVAINNRVAGTFSKSMDPTTITTANFTVTGPGSSPVTGTVNYDALSQTATFAPSSNLAPSTTYTASITGGVNGVKDLAGNSLASNKVWTFTTGTQISQAPINLGRAGTFAVMATASITSTGPTQINGDVGLNAGSSQGIPPSEVNGTIHVDDQAIIDAQSDLLAAYNDAVSRSVTSVILPGNMGGLTFTPGLYTNSTSVLISGAGANNNVTLDAQGDPNAIFIFKMGSTLTTGPGAQVILAGGAKAGNVFWQVGTSATLDTTTIFEGNILAAVTITVNTGSVVVGRLLGGSNSDGSVTVNASTVTVPAA